MPVSRPASPHAADPKAVPPDVIANCRLSDRLIRRLLWLAYRLDLLRAYLLRPCTAGAYVALWYRDQILLILNSYKSVYTLPCGKIERGESAREAAARELREEVGILVELDALCPSFTTVNRSEFKQDAIQVFDLRLDELPVLRLDGREVSWAGFRTAEQAQMLPLHPPVADYLRDRDEQSQLATRRESGCRF
ncbi:MAG: NUDIX hydrolase [Chromatiaceae bacterium]|nr:NUDIX hydrolase [Chromatiaceae bacterium]